MMEITKDRSQRQFRAELDGEPAVLGYAERDGALDLQHTFVPPAERGKGVGERLVRYVMEDARDEGYKVIPTCPFVAQWVEKHPEFQDVVKR